MKKILSMVLALAMVLSMVLTATAEETEVYRFDKPITLKVSVFDRGNAGGTAPDDNYYTKWIQENFGDPRNITIEWVVIPRSEEEAKLNQLLAGGPETAPDLCFTYNGNLTGSYVEQGGLLELTDLLNEYGPNIKKLLGENVINAGRKNGGLYAICARRVNIADQGVFIRKDWVEKAGLEMPTTKAELLDVLRYFRDHDMDGDGDATNEIPWAIASDLRVGSSAIFSLSFLKDVSDRTMACSPRPMIDGYKDYALFLNQMYHEGLISPDFALDKTETYFNDITSGRAGVYQGNWDHPIRVSPGILAALQTYLPDAELAPLECFESASDPTKYYHGMYGAHGLNNFIPVFCKHPEAAMMYLDWLCQPDVIFALQNGVEGITYDLNADGVPVVKNPDAANHDKTFNSMQNLDYTLLINGQYLADESLLIKAQALSYQGYADEYEALYKAFHKDPLNTGWTFEVVLQASSEYGTRLGEFENEMLTKVTMADPAEASALFDKMLEEYKAMGGQACYDEATAAWDAAH